MYRYLMALTDTLLPFVCVKAINVIIHLQIQDFYEVIVDEGGAKLAIRIHRN